MFCSSSQVSRVLILTSKNSHIGIEPQGKKRAGRRRQRKRHRGSLLITIWLWEGKETKNQGSAAWSTNWVVAGIARIWEVLMCVVSESQVERMEGQADWLYRLPHSVLPSNHVLVLL